MGAFIYGVLLQWKLDIRNKGIVLTYYVVPLVFFGFMGGIFTSIDPASKQTLIQSMTIFAISMGAFLGSPIPLVELYGSEIKKAYKVGGIPLWIAVVNNLISGFIHLFIVSLVIFFLAPIAFNAAMPDNLVLHFTVVAVFIFTSLLIGTVLGLFIKNMTTLTMVSQFLFLPSIMLSGIMFPSSMLPKVFESLGKVFPATWAYTNMCRNSLAELSMIPLLIIIIVAIVSITLQIKRLEK